MILDIIQLGGQLASLLGHFFVYLLVILVTSPFLLAYNAVFDILHRFHDARPPGSKQLEEMMRDNPSTTTDGSAAAAGANGKGDDDGAAASTLPLEPVVFYEGTVTHVRSRPVENSFNYNVRMAVVNLDDPPTWFRPSRNENLSAGEARALAGTEGPVRVLTHPPAVGYVQNPISVYYCYDKRGRLQKGIAEVTNTPWGERVTFLFSPDGECLDCSLLCSCFCVHVSATCPL
jgi:hypothetical protein